MFLPFEHPVIVKFLTIVGVHDFSIFVGLVPYVDVEHPMEGTHSGISWDSMMENDEDIIRSYVRHTYLCWFDYYNKLRDSWLLVLLVLSLDL